MLISLHLPKTAGSSFRATLASHFGDSLRLEYAERPLHLGDGERNWRAIRGCLHHALHGLEDPTIACVHGHFLPLRYRWLRCREELRFVTWMRDPVQRLVSHYYYWQRTYEADHAPRLHRMMMEEKWSLETFALHPALRNVYGRFLWGFPISRFDFIGISEDYAQELQVFAERFLSTAPESARENSNPSNRGEPYEVPDALLRKISAAHAADLELYRRALQMREARQALS